MADAPLPDLILYSRADCGLCGEARELIQALLDDRKAHRLPVPRLDERDITDDPAWERTYVATIPVVELGDRRLETVIGLQALRRLLSEVLDPATSSA